MRPPDRHPRETDSLLGHSSTIRAPRSYLQRLASYLTADINPEHGELVLLFCYIITGLLDSSAVFIWGSFASMQTGNTVYLGLGLTGADPSNRWIKAATSIGSFCVGSFCFASFHRWGSPLCRWVICCSFVIQPLCVSAAATIVTVQQSSGPSSELGWQVMVPLALVAFQSSGQAVTSRVLNCNGLTSVVLTSVYCDLFSLPGVSMPTRPIRVGEEGKRVGAVACMMLGIVFGGLWAKTSIGLIGALWTVVFGKGVIVLAWLFWKGRD